MSAVITVRLGQCGWCLDIFSVEASFVPVSKKPGWHHAVCESCYTEARLAGLSPLRGPPSRPGRIIRRMGPTDRWRPQGRPEKPLSLREQTLLRGARFDDGVGPEPTQLRAARTRRDEHGTWIELT